MKEKIDERIKNIPDKIYLQVGDNIGWEVDFKELEDTGEVTWCSDKIENWDIEYIRASELERLINQEVERRIAETVAGKFIAVEIEKRIADRFPSKEEILKYFNNHFNCHADVIIGDYETTEIAMTIMAVLKMFEWLRSRLAKTEGGGE